MDPVNGLSQIAQILRQKLAQKAEQGTKKSLAGDKAAGAANANRRLSSEELQRKLGERIRALPDQHSRDTRAVNIFVEVVLAWEFGDEVLQDLGIDTITQEVALVLQSEPRLRKKLDELLNGLAKPDVRL